LHEARGRIEEGRRLREASLAAFETRRAAERAERAHVARIADTLEHITPPPDGDAASWRLRLADLASASRGGAMQAGHVRDFSRLVTGFRATLDAEMSMLDGWVLESALLAGLVFASGVQVATLGADFVPAFVVLVLTTLPFLSVVLLRHGLVSFYLTYDRELRFWEAQVSIAQDVAATAVQAPDPHVGDGPGCLSRLYAAWDQSRARRVRLSWCGNLRRLGLLMFFCGVALVLFPITPIGALVAALILSAVFTVGEISDIGIRHQFSRPLRRALALSLRRRG
jgi:hypothetical protein